MDYRSYLQGVKSRKEILAMAESFTAGEYSLESLIDLCLHRNKQLAFHAAWLLENVVLQDISLLSTHLSYFLAKLPHITNDSVRRHFTKILCEVLTRYRKKTLGKEAEYLLEWVDTEPLVTACFEWLIDERVGVAVKVYCMDCLYYLAQKHAWIQDEFVPTVMSIDPVTPALAARTRMLVARIKKTGW